MRYINVNSAELAAPHSGSHQCSAVSPILHTGVSVLHPGRPCVLGCGWLAAGKFSSAMQTDAPGGLPRAQAWHRVAPWAGRNLGRDRPTFPGGWALRGWGWGGRQRRGLCLGLASPSHLLGNSGSPWRTKLEDLGATVVSR